MSIDVGRRDSATSSVLRRIARGNAVKFDDDRDLNNDNDNDDGDDDDGSQLAPMSASGCLALADVALKQASPRLVRPCAVFESEFCSF